MATQDLSGRAAARARRNAQVQGKAALPAKSGATPAPAAKPAAPAPAPAPAKPVARATRSTGTANANPGRTASRARREAMSSRGKAGVSSSDRQRVIADIKRNAAEQVSKKAGDCGCGCGGRGDCGKGQTQAAPQLSAPAKSVPTRRRNNSAVNPSNAGRMNARARRQALATMGKNGADVIRKGMSSAQLARQQNPNISGRDVARSVRTERSRNGSTNSAPSAPVGRRRPQPQRASDDVTGTRVSHSTKTTGDETGLCRSVTGTDYFSSDVFSQFCQTEAPKVPTKVAVTETMRGGQVTSGGVVGRSGKVTGDESGSCRPITGSEYVGREQYDDFCATKPEPGTAKVSFSKTTRGQIVSGSKPARSEKVTGDEAGTCKAVTGTPYAGVEQYREYCEPGQSKLAEARTLQRRGNAGRDITGIQPGLSGLTGAGKGACKPVSGTGYVGADQHQEVCGTTPAQVGEADFPQPLTGAPWGEFSVVPPSHASQQSPMAGNVTGTQYEQGRISGTFSMGEGKVTGTEQFRFGDGNTTGTVTPITPTEVNAEESPKSRVTGEGIDTGLKITGDDWDRGERVTGTEGSSAMKRNPTRKGPAASAMRDFASKRNEDLERPSAAVTGSAGNTEKGAAITVSGGARG